MEAEEKDELAKAGAKLKAVTTGKSTADITLPLATLPPAQPRARPNIIWPQLTPNKLCALGDEDALALQAARVWEAIERTDVDFEVDREALLGIYSAVPDSVMALLAGRDSAKAA